MSTAKFDTLSNLAGTQTVPVATVAQGSAKAWVNFNGTGTVAIRASFNVSSITDGGTGDYTLNFTNAMVDADYVVSGTAMKNGASNDGSAGVYLQVFGSTTYSAAYTTNSVRVLVKQDTAVAIDPLTVNVAIFR